MDTSSRTFFDNLPDAALIQVRPLVNLKILPFSATTIWRLSRAGKFPRPSKVSPGVTAWRVGDIREYLERVASKSNGVTS